VFLVHVKGSCEFARWYRASTGIQGCTCWHVSIRRSLAMAVLFCCTPTLSCTFTLFCTFNSVFLDQHLQPLGPAQPKQLVLHPVALLLLCSKAPVGHLIS
jgi:hypothetical protein